MPCPFDGPPLLSLRGLVAWLAAGTVACAHVVPAAPPGVERVVFVGDSLVNRSDRDHGLLDQVQRALAGSHPAPRSTS